MLGASLSTVHGESLLFSSIAMVLFATMLAFRLIREAAAEKR